MLHPAVADNLRNIREGIGQLEALSDAAYTRAPSTPSARPPKVASSTPAMWPTSTMAPKTGRFSTAFACARFRRQ